MPNSCKNMPKNCPIFPQNKKPLKITSKEEPGMHIAH